MEPIHANWCFPGQKAYKKEHQYLEGELAAAHLNAMTGFVVRRSFGKYHKGYTTFTDSQVALYWIHSRDKPVKQWIRSRVMRLTGYLIAQNGYIYIQSQNNIADMGTRKGVQVKDVDQSLLWRNGYPWMSEEESDIPTITIETLPLMNIKDDVNLEMHKHGQVLDVIELTHGKDYYKNGISGTYLNISPSRNEVPEDYGIGRKV